MNTFIIYDKPGTIPYGENTTRKAAVSRLPIAYDKRQTLLDGGHMEGWKGRG